MNSKLTSAVVGAVFVLALGLAGCSSSSPGGGGGEPPADPGYGAPSSPSSSDEMGATMLKTADPSLGEIVVDGEGMTVYMFDKDTKDAGKSTCEGQCAQNWPAVTTDGDPEVEGVTGEVGTITGVDGKTQVTLNGWPLYYFAGDSAAGDTKGQGVNDVWWVLTPAGERMAG